MALVVGRGRQRGIADLDQIRGVAPVILGERPLQIVLAVEVGHRQLPQADGDPAMAACWAKTVAACTVPEATSAVTSWIDSPSCPADFSSDLACPMSC